MIMWIIIILFAVMSVVLLAGKGGFLIAGYNTASPAEKARYDEKKLCRVMGAGMLVITLLLIGAAAQGENISNGYIAVLIVGIFAVTAAMMVLTNKVCRRKEAVVEEAAAGSSAKQKAVVRGSLIVAGVITAAVLFFLFTGEVKVTVTDQTLEIGASYWSDDAIELSQIRNISLVRELERGVRTNGIGSFKLAEGNFRNEDFGEYKLYTYTDAKQHIVLETEQGVVVLGLESEQATELLYQQLVDVLK